MPIVIKALQPQAYICTGVWMSILRDNINSGPAGLRKLLDSKEIIIAPGVFDGISAIIAEKAGFNALYLSGSGIAGVMGLPDLSVTTMDEVLHSVRNIVAVSKSPLIVDVDTGFGEPLNVIRTVRELERAGGAGMHIEDQKLPKKCGHLNGKVIVPEDEMTEKLDAAVSARKNKDFVIIARTDSRAVEGLDAAIVRANEYVRHGADAIFVEALESKEEFEECARKIKAPLLANMTEYGKSPLLSAGELEKIGYKIVIFPLTAFRSTLSTMEKVYGELRSKGTQKDMLDSIMQREKFYDIIGYDEYEKEDDEISRHIK